MADLKQLARQIFHETMAAIDIPRTMQRKLQRRGTRIVCGEKTFDLKDFGKIRVVGVGKAAHAMVEGLVQTLAPSARAIAFASRHDADGFLADELQRRKLLGYPPYGSLIRIVCSAAEPGEAQSVASALHAQIHPPGTSVLGPAPMLRRYTTLNPCHA